MGRFGGGGGSILKTSCPVNVLLKESNCVPPLTSLKRQSYKPISEIGLIESCTFLLERASRGGSSPKLKGGQFADWAPKNSEK